MLPNLLHGVVQKLILTEVELSAIKELAAICDHHEQLHMLINWNMLQSRPGTNALDFFYYDQGVLVGYLALDNWGIADKEVVGMVHPAYRRRGIFRALLAVASAESKQLGAERLLLICERASESGQAFVRAVGADHSFAEHEMVLAALQERGMADERLCFRRATSEDLDALAAIIAAGFDDPLEDVRYRLARGFQDTRRQFYLTTYGNSEVECEEPVGCLRMDQWNDTLGIYAFAVLPDYQGRGYGRYMLEEAVRTVRAMGSTRTVFLYVDERNIRAFSLYHSCGFEIKATYDYYIYPRGHKKLA